MQVTGVPSFPFYMPGSAPVEYEHENALRQRALHLAARGYDAGLHINSGDPYLGKVIESGSMFYQSPQVPGYHFQQGMVEGYMRPPTMLPGSLSDRIAYELAQQAYLDDRADGVWHRLSPQHKVYEAILREAKLRASQGRPIRRPRQA